MTMFSVKRLCIWDKVTISYGTDSSVQTGCLVNSIFLLEYILLSFCYYNTHLKNVLFIYEQMRTVKYDQIDILTSITHCHCWEHSQEQSKVDHYSIRSEELIENNCLDQWLSPVNCGWSVNVNIRVWFFNLRKKSLFWKHERFERLWWNWRQRGNKTQEIYKIFDAMFNTSFSSKRIRSALAYNKQRRTCSVDTSIM